MCTLPQTSAPKQAHQYVIAFCCILVSCSVWKMQTGCKHGQKVEELETWSLCRAYWCILHMLLINMNELYMYCNWIQSSLRFIPDISKWSHDVTVHGLIFCLEVLLGGTMKCSFGTSKYVHFAILSLGPFHYLRWLCHFLLEATFHCEPQRLWRCGVL